MAELHENKDIIPREDGTYLIDASLPLPDFARYFEIDIANKESVSQINTVGGLAFRFGEKSNDPVEMFLADIYTVFANLVGIPGISIPLFSSASGLPFGIQAMAARNNEITLLRAAKEFLQFEVANS